MEALEALFGESFLLGESFLFGIEPLTALAIGAGAVLLAPVIGAASSAMNQSAESAETSNPVSQAVDTAGDTARDWVKGAMVWGLEVVEGVQTSAAEVGESFQDFVAEAKADYEAKKAEKLATEASTRPHVVEIVE